MNASDQSNGPIRFGVFEVELAGRTLRKSGVRIRLQEKPFRLLAILLARPGEVVTREELKQELWPDDEYGEFDLGLNTAVKKLRQALGDSAESPRWIETVPKLGYKFLGPVETVATPPGPASTASVVSRPNGWPTIAAAAVAASVLTWALVSSGDSVGPETLSQVYRFTVEPPEGTLIRSFALSPDGRHLAFVAEKGEDVRLWLRTFSEEEARPVEGADHVDPSGTPFWSPDSRHIGFFDAGKLKRVGIAGEPPVALTDVQGGRGGSWNQDGVIVFAPIESGPDAQIYSMPDTGGELERVTEGRINSHRSPFFLPDGRQFLFLYRIAYLGGGGDAEIRLGKLGDLEAKVLMSQRLQAAYIPSASGPKGYVLTVEDGVLMARAFDPESGEFAGEPFPTVGKVGIDVPMSLGLFSVSSSGALAYLTEDGPHLTRELLWVDRQGAPIRSYGSYGSPFSAMPLGVRIAPDGARAAVVTAFAPGRGAILETVDLRDGASLEIADGLFFAWSPDGKSFAAGGPQNKLRTIAADGSRDVLEVLSESFARVRDWSRDGNWILLEDISRGDDNGDLLVADVGSREVKPFLASDFDERAGRFSPDGRYLAYSSNETGEEQIYVVRFPEGDGKRKVSFDGGVLPLWRPDGKELYFTSPQAMMMAASVAADGDGLRFGRPQTLFPHETDPQLLRDHVERFPRWDTAFSDAAPDGQRFLVTRGKIVSTPSPVHVVVNWTEELDRLAQERGAAP